MAPCSSLREQEPGVRSSLKRDQTRSNHVFRAQDVGEHFVVEQAFFAHQFQHAAAAFEGDTGDAGGVFIADVRVQCGDQADRVFDQFAAALFVGGDADDAVFAQHVHGALQQTDRVEDLERDQRLHHVQLQLAAFGRDGQGQVVTDDLERYLVNRFRNNRVDLAWLTRWQVDFVNAGTWAAGQQAQVVADLRQLDRSALEHAGEQHEGAHVRGGFDQVGGWHQRLTADQGQALNSQVLVTRVGVDAGTDRCAAQVYFGQQLRSQSLQACQVFAQGSGEGAEFLAEGHRHGVLQLGTAHFQDVVELYTLGGERLDQAVEAGQQRVVTKQQAQTDRRRVGVVGRLRHVHVVVRVQVLVFALLVTHGLQRDVGDDFVGIHVGRSASAALNHVYHELFVEIAADQTCTGFADGCVLGFAQMTQLAVGVSGGLFNHGQADNQLRVVRNRDAGETEVVHRSQGLDAVIRLSGYFEYAKQVFFCAERCSGGHDRNHLDMDPVCAGTLQMLGL